MANPLKKLAGQTAIYGLSSIVGRLLNYLLVPLYTRLFVPSEYGIVTELYAYVTFLLILLTYGMETGFFRFAQESSTPQSKLSFNTVYSSILTSLFVTSSVFILLVVIFLKPISIVLQYEAHPEYILWMCIIVAIDAFISVPFAKLRQEEKAVRFAILKIINIGINIGLNLFFLLLCPRLYAHDPNFFLSSLYSPSMGVGYVFISNLIANIATLLMLLPDILHVKYHFDWRLLKKILLYSAPLLIGGFAGMINETLDRVLLKYLVPAEQNPMAQLGIYGANYKLAILMTLFIQTFRYAADPFFFANKNKDRKIYADATKYFIICCLIIFLGVMFYIDIIKYFIDESYHEGLTVVPILLLANMFLGIFYNLSIWYKLNDQTKYGAYLAIFGAVLTIILNVALIPIIGYKGSAWATFICYAMMMVASFVIGQKHYKIPYNVKNALFYFGFAIVLYAISILLRPHSQIMVYVFNTLLLATFVATFAIKEKIWLLLKK